MRTTILIGAVVVFVFSAGLQTYDSLLTASSPLATPVCGARVIQYFYQQMDYILCYGSSLVGQGWTGGFFGKYITPFDWLVYYTPVGYISTSVKACTTTSTGTTCTNYVALAYYGVTNLIETWTTWIWAPLAAYVMYKQFSRKQEGLDQYVEGESNAIRAYATSGEVRFAGLALILFLWTYIPYVFLYLEGRVTYPFYFVAAVPAVAMGASYLLTRKQLPRWVTYIFVIAALLFFLVFFPVKDFLPVWLRALIGH